MPKSSATLSKSNKSLQPDMDRLKYELMSENAFRFFRGTCHLFYEDLSKANNVTATPLTWVSGDLHLENFGSFKGNNRMVYFDLNDFDEAMLAPLSWEIVRVLTSIFVAFNSLNIRFSEAKKAAELFLATYSDTLSGGKAYYIDPRTAEGIVKKFLKTAKKRKAIHLVKSMATLKSNHFKIDIDNKDYFEIDLNLKIELIQHLTKWIKDTEEWPNNYEVKDVVFRVAGVSSVGINRYLFLLQSKKKSDKFILVEMKAERPSSLEPFNQVSQPTWKSQAERIITIQQRMQNMSPALLSPTTFNGETYVLQEMQPEEDKIKFELIRDHDNYLETVVKDMASLTASAQLRSGGIQGSAIIDELMAFGREKNWREPLMDYAINYSKKVVDDFNLFTKGNNTVGSSAARKQKITESV